MNVCFETFGCRLNKAEALQQEAEYLAKGWQLTRLHSEADLIVIRGCSVTARAQYEGEKLIAHLRKHYPAKSILVQGCLPEAQRALPPVSSLQVKSSEALPTRTARAYLKVQDGCSGKCTFCIVPTYRGSSTSVDFDRLLDRARQFIDAGYHELVVTGCNLALYASQGKRLPELLEALAGLSADCRVRLGSVEPGEVAVSCAELMAERDNLCKFLHMPIQSGSDRILQAMGRPYRIRDVERLVVRATALMPNLGLGCDLMTGFPGESELDFFATRGLLERFPFSNVHVFPYSERKGTPAAALANVISKTIRSERAHRLIRLAQDHRRAFARRFIGKVVDVVVENGQPPTGWTGEYLPVEAMGAARRKSLIKVVVSRWHDGKLHGHILRANDRVENKKCVSPLS